MLVGLRAGEVSCSPNVFPPVFFHHLNKNWRLYSGIPCTVQKPHQKEGCERFCETVVPMILAFCRERLLFIAKDKSSG